MITKHGPSAVEADTKEWLEQMKQLFRTIRDDKVAKQPLRIQAAQTRINELTSSPNPMRPEKIAERQVSIQKQNDTVNEANNLVTQYQAINENDKHDVFEALDKWKT